MNNTISVPRELLERIVGKCKLSVLGDDHAKVWELLTAQPSAEVVGLEVVAWIDPSDMNKMENHGYKSCVVKADKAPCYTEPLCSLPKAQAIIEQLEDKLDYANQKTKVIDKLRRMLDQQAARIKELSGLLLESVGMVRGTIGNQDNELADRIDAAMGNKGE